MTVHRLAVFVAIVLAFWFARAAHGYDEDNPAASLEFTIETRGSARVLGAGGEPVSRRIHRRISGEFALRGAYASSDLISQMLPSSAPSAAEIENAKEIQRQFQACGSDVQCKRRLAMRMVELQQQTMAAMSNPLRYLIWELSYGQDRCILRWSESIDDQKTEIVRIDDATGNPVRTQRTTTYRASRQRPSLPPGLWFCVGPILATAVGASNWTVAFSYLPNLTAEAEITIADRTTRTERGSVELVAQLNPLALVIRGTGDPKGAVTLQGVVEDERVSVDGRSWKIPVEVTITWAAKNIAEVKAEPGGPYPISRGDTVTLDGSKSKGVIKKYRWILSPGQGCPSGLEPVQMEGRTQSFRVLCSLQGSLTVHGEDDTDTTNFSIDVTPRPGWKIDFKTAPESQMGERIDASILRLGKNRCAMHEDDSGPDHWIHLDRRNPHTWENVGYDVAQITAGPFRGYWYVSRERLEIHRQPFINKNLLPGGLVYDLNANNRENRDRLVRSVRAHEWWHTELARRRLEQGGRDFDPAVQIERLASAEREQLVFDADRAIRQVQTELSEASSEIEVKKKLRESADFNRSGKIILPVALPRNDVVCIIINFAELGDDPGLVGGYGLGGVCPSAP